MDITRRNDVSIYCLSSGPTIPEWLGDRARRNLSKKDDAVRRRIELLQDFQMPASSSKLAQSPDGRYIMVTGTYPPRVRCYDLHQLSMKFERYVNAEVIDIAMLGEDYGKFALLQEDRTIAFHAPYGGHESIRIPTFGRAMAYEPTNCELLVAAKGNSVYRVNLDEGRFSEPWTYDASSVSASCITVNPSYPAACVGCDDGMVRFWDSRASDTLLRPALKLDVQSATVGYGYAQDEGLRYANSGEITSLAFDPTGMYLAAGTGGGLVALYDVRSSRPLYVQEHKDGQRIHTIKFHAESGLVLSGDERLVKAWRYKSMSTDSGFDDAVASTNEKDGKSVIGHTVVNIEGSSKLTNFIVAGDESDPTGNKSGIILCAADQPKLESYFVPAIGVAPKWCSFLDSITEELEERDLDQEDGATDELVRSGKESIYENYKFVTRDDLEKLGVSNLIGTPLLRGYMHGFFMNVNLYNRVKAVANPFEYEEYQKKKLRERLEAKRSSRIAPKDSGASSAKTAVNPELAERLQHKAEDSTKAGKVAKNVLSDDRFGSLFTNPDFQINEDDEDFKLRNPSGVAAVQRKKNNLDSDDEDDEASVSDNEKVDVEHSAGEGRIDGGIDSEEGDFDEESALESDSEDGFRGGRVRGEAFDALRALDRVSEKKQKSVKKAPTLYEAEGLDNAGAIGLATGAVEARNRARKRLEEMEIPLERRLASSESQHITEIRISSGSKEASFIPSDTKRKLEAEKESAGEARGKRNRRGIKELKLKTPFKNHRR